MIQDNKDILVLLAEDLDGNYETLWSTYFNQLYAFVLRKTRNKDDAWDIIQETFERAYRHLKGYPPQAVLTLKIRPWLYKITWNIYLNFVTRYKRPTSELIGISEDDFVYNVKNDQRAATNENVLESDWRVRPDVVVESAETRREIENLMAKLPTNCQEVIGFHYLDELSYQEIADILQQPVGTIRVRIHRCTQRLRSLLETWESEAS